MNSSFIPLLHSDRWRINPGRLSVATSQAWASTLMKLVLGEREGEGGEGNIYSEAQAIQDVSSYCV